MDIIKDLLKGANPIIILLLAFLIWQVINHIPTQIKEVKQEIKETRKELSDKIDENQKVLNDKIERLNNKMDKILFYLIDGDKTKLKEGIKEK